MLDELSFIIILYLNLYMFCTSFVTSNCVVYHPQIERLKLKTIWNL